MELREQLYEAIKPNDEEEEDAAEVDETGRFSRYSKEVGTGRFKHVYKGFDERQGIDIAWSRILQQANGLDDVQMTSIVQELEKGIDLDHPNIIKCYRAWHDKQAGCINFITEFFTSGNLRDYRQRHKHLELKAVRKWARQILLGLDYLHKKEPTVVHGDLRCDKIYINGHSGEIKIGDLGLATLQARRFAPGVLPNGCGNGNQYTRAVDVFAFGLCVLELATAKKLDHSAQQSWAEVVEAVQDAETKAFVSRCLSPLESRPSASQLLEDPFFCVRKAERAPSQKQLHQQTVVETHVGSPLILRPPGPSSRTSFSSDDAPGAICEIGMVRGEDFNFKFSGKVKEGKLHFRLEMEYEGDEPQSEDEESRSRTIDFVYDPDEDTPDEIALEIGNEFSLSSTDRDICAAALKEWLAKGLEDQD